MIQAAELRIGNKVIFGVGPVPATVFTIEYTRKDGYLINGQVPQDHVHPIPLSPDILEKIGCKMLAGEWTHPCGVWLTECGSGKYSGYHTSGFRRGHTIKYLHQYQNVVFDLTGEELTLNL